MSDQSALVPYETAEHAFGEGAGETLKALANAGADAMCTLYQNYPGYATGSNFHNPIAAYNDGLLDSLCRPRNKLPALRPTPPTGGQCVGREYNVNITHTPKTGASSTFNSARFAPIGGIEYDRYSDSDGNKKFDAYILAGTNSAGSPGRFQLTGNEEDGGTYVINSITPVDGMPDTCGDMEKRYPVDNPALVNVNFNTSVQLSPTVNVMVPVEIFAPIEIFAPSLRLGDVNIDLNLGGLKVEFNNNNNYQPANPPTQPQPQPGTGDKPVERNDTAQLEKVLKYLERLRECQECDSDFNFFNITSGSGVSGSITVPSGGIIVSIGFQILSEPSNAKIEPGLSEPDTIYAGWCWFDGNNYLSERMPIDARLKLYQANEERPYQSFRWTMRFAYTGKCVMRYKVLKNPLPVI